MTMRLSTRLSLFFLGALGLVLVGFSASLYVLASKYLHRQADERLEGALNTLVAAAEFGPEGVEWEPKERSLSFGRLDNEDQFSWIVCDSHGRQLDGSATGNLDQFLHDWMLSGSSSRRPQSAMDRRGRTWRMMYRRLEPSRGSRRETAEREEQTTSDDKHAALVFGAGISLEGVERTLQSLAGVLVVLSLGIWTLALGFGRRLSCRALRPLTHMAQAAQAIDGDELDRRLPIPQSGDELAELGLSFNALLDRLSESFERQRRFTGDASHQLRTPLTAMLGQVDLALRRERPPAEYERVLTLVQRQAGHLRQIVEALLFLSRADQEALRPDLATIELSAWLTDQFRFENDDHRASDLRLEIGADGPFLVRAHPALLSELLNNLLDNATKYSEPGTPIVVRLNREFHCVLLSVEDQGVGIIDEEIPLIFEPFYRSRETRNRGIGGLGLGLSVADRLAHSFGGSIEVRSEVRRGSCFTMRFPAESGTHAHA